MDFLIPTKKRAQTIRLVLGYFLVGVALVLATLILVFQSYGYDLDRKTGAVIQNGLVFLTSQPVSASIYLNDQLQKNQTDTRLTLPAGQYTIRLQHDGYRSWQRTFQLDGGSIERLDYPFLFPNKLSPKDTQAYAAAPPMATQSPDRHWLLVEQSDNLTNFDQYDLSNPTQAATKISLPANQLTATKATQTFKVVEWSTDNRHVLLLHTYGTAQEYIILDRQSPTDSFNVNRTFHFNPDQVALNDKHFDSLLLYNQTTKELSVGSAKDGSVSAFQSNVLAFKSYGNDMLLYVTDQGAEAGKVLVKLRENDTSYTMRDFSAGAHYLLELAKFDNAWYAVCGAAQEGRIYIYKNPLDTLKSRTPGTLTPISILHLDNPTKVSFSANTRFVAAQSAEHFAVYDADDDRRFDYKLKFQLQPPQEAIWMDGHRLMVTQNGSTTIFDFDGLNSQFLTPSSLPEGGFFDRDYTHLFNIAPSVSTPGKYALTQADLKIK